MILLKLGLNSNRSDCGGKRCDCGNHCNTQVLFHTVDKASFQGLDDIASVVKTNVGRRLRVLVQRDNSDELLGLVPGAWKGPGVLGCRFVPDSN